MKLKKLYQKTTTGKIQMWQISVENKDTLVTVTGQVDGKKITNRDTIKAGKNTGRANATTIEEQAIKEAKARFQKQLKKGYVKSIEDAQAGKVDKIIKGGDKPQLAHNWNDHKKKIIYPAATQPKLDGNRMIYDSSALWSRTRKPINSLPHILKQIQAFNAKYGENLFDGEAYNHEYKDDFEEIQSNVRSEKQLGDNYEKIQYHIYDLRNPEMDFKTKIDRLNFYAKQVKGKPEFSALKFVETRIVKNEEELLSAYEEFMEAGYEGAMVRNLANHYEGKRSYNLQKVKVMQDAEFKVVGILEGRGKLQGHVGSFILEIKTKQKGLVTFKAKLEGKTSELKKYFEDEKLWKNKMMTVQFQGFYKKTGKPRFPIGLRFRKKGF